MPELVDRGVIESLAREWRDEVSRRRRISSIDATADALDFCAGELAARLRAAAESQDVTVEMFARMHKVTPQTVRIWCRTGAIAAQDTAKGWRIPKDEKPPKRARKSA